MELGQKENQYSVNLEILNISSDAQVTIKIWNEIGDLTHTMQIKYDPPLPQIEIGNEEMGKVFSIFSVCFTVWNLEFENILA